MGCASRAFVVAAACIAAVAVGAKVTSHSIHGFSPAGWTMMGDAMATDSLVRVVPDRQSKRGGMWNLDPVLYKDWEVEFSLRIHGVSGVGADGMAFWYVRDIPNAPGELFGNEELFSGLGIVVDTYDNSNSGVHPYLFALNNDGTYRYTYAEHEHRNHVDSNTDAATVRGELNGCTARIRNTRESSTVRVQYVDQRLTVSYRTDPISPFVPCFSIPRITLPVGYYFGFTAATGDLADDHDLTNFTVVDPKDSPLSRPIGAASTGACPVAAAAAAATRPVQPGDSVQKSIGDMQAKLDGVLDIVRDTLRTLSKNPTVTAAAASGPVSGNEVQQMFSVVRSIQAQMNTVVSQSSDILQIVRALSNDVKLVQAKQNVMAQQPQQPAGQKKEGGVMQSILLLGLVIFGALAAFFFVQLRRERSEKKLF